MEFSDNDNEPVRTQMARLDERFNALEKKVDAGNVVIISKIKELQDGFVARLERVESTKFPSTDFIQFRNNDYVPLKEVVDKLVEYKSTIRGGMVALGVFTPIVAALITAWLTSKFVH